MKVTAPAAEAPAVSLAAPGACCGLLAGNRTDGLARRWKRRILMREFFSHSRGHAVLHTHARKFTRLGGGARNHPPTCAAAPTQAPACVRSFPRKTPFIYRHFWPPIVRVNDFPVGKKSRMNGGMRSCVDCSELPRPGGGLQGSHAPAGASAHVPKRPGCRACSAVKFALVLCAV